MLRIVQRSTLLFTGIKVESKITTEYASQFHDKSLETKLHVSLEFSIVKIIFCYIFERGKYEYIFKTSCNLQDLLFVIFPISQREFLQNTKEYSILKDNSR